MNDSITAGALGWRFASASYLHWLWILPVLFVLFRIWSKRAEARFRKNLGGKTVPLLTASVSQKKRKWKIYLQLIALTLMIVSYARPQAGVGYQNVKNEGIEILLVMDVSNSMRAEDIKPSRLEFARSELLQFVNMSGGERMGVVAFAGPAALLCPLTTDQDAVKMYLRSLSTDSVSTQGTDFQKALAVADEAFKNGGLGGQPGVQVTRAILLVSDGQDNEPGALVEAEKLAKQGIHIFTLAVGTAEGAPIPIRDSNGQLTGYMRDAAGQVVMTKVSGKELEAMARMGHGAFYHATYEDDAVRAVRTEISRLHQTQFKSGRIPIFKEFFQWPLFFALVIALIEIWLGERKEGGRWRGRFEVPR